MNSGSLFSLQKIKGVGISQIKSNITKNRWCRLTITTKKWRKKKLNQYNFKFHVLKKQMLQVDIIIVYHRILESEGILEAVYYHLQ